MPRLHDNINAEIRELLQEWEFIKAGNVKSSKYLHWSHKAASLLKQILEEYSEIEHIYVLRKLEHHNDDIAWKDIAYFRTEREADLWAEKNIIGVYKVEKVMITQYDKSNTQN